MNLTRLRLNHHMKRRSQLRDDVMHYLITLHFVSVVAGNVTDGADGNYVVQQDAVSFAVKHVNIATLR
jgi:hypothetical protein